MLTVTAHPKIVTLLSYDKGELAQLIKKANKALRNKGVFRFKKGYKTVILEHFILWCRQNNCDINVFERYVVKLTEIENKMSSFQRRDYNMLISKLNNELDNMPGFDKTFCFDVDRVDSVVLDYFVRAIKKAGWGITVIRHSENDRFRRFKPDQGLKIWPIKYPR